MKKGKLFLALGLSFTFAFGLGATLSLDRDVQAVQAEGASGTVKVYLNSNWSEAACNISVYFFDDDAGKNGWGSYVAVPQGQFEVDVSYNLDWTPKSMIAVRYNSNYSQQDWESNGWGSKWNQAPESGGYALGDHITITGPNSGETAYPYIGSSAVGFGNKMNLEGVKLNGSNHFEYFSDAVSFAKNEEFKIVYNNEWYNGYSLADVVTNNFSRENDGANIKCLVAGTYALYFDSYSKSVHITDPVLAAADEWAQDFLNGGCTASKGGWATAADDFDALLPESKALFVNEEHISNDASANTYIKQAVQRYDYVLQRYGVNAANTDEAGYEDFMGRVAAGKISLAPRVFPMSIGEEISNSSTIVTLLVTIALLSVATGYLVIRRRRMNQLGK